ncbi:hypothetical protein MLD38_024307 [Melastoma candidum]|uniref:Uncharacterized protein n=1 Tax=Melastoma candidum TaxID=119954 RepID=A0ACB9NVA1_9MYRT|nr:hypothetical protein MLD38_024307 [Melastoma candidum]
MAESSRSRVTITLGHGRQVVRRATDVSDGPYKESTSPIGRKNSVRDRLGEDAESSLSQNGPVGHKRQRDDISFSSRGSNGVADMPIGRDDLRFKLMRKNVSRHALNEERQSGMDLREKLSKTVHSSTKMLNAPRQMLERKDGSYMSRIPPSSVMSDFPSADNLGRSSYAYRSMDLDHVRKRSPERLAASSRGLSPPRSREDMLRIPMMRPSDNTGSITYMRKDVLEPPGRASTNAAYMRNPTHPTLNARPPQPVLGQPPPLPAAVVQRSSFMVNEHQTVDGLLQALGLGKYAILFKAEEIDMTALKQMGESDLKEIGIPMGPRKKILLAIAPRSKRQQ